MEVITFIISEWLAMPDTVLSTSLLLICLIVATRLLESPHFIDEEPDPQ